MTSEQPSQSKETSQEGKDKQSRRLWTSKEEETLLNVMLDCISPQWRADNGFKAGFFVFVHKQMKKLLPDTDIKVKPNILSKVKNWKEKFGAITDAARISGFNWNQDTYTSRWMMRMFGLNMRR